MKHVSVFALILLPLFLTACSKNEGAFPHATNPPPFDYADGEELRSRMHQLAYALQRLDRALADDDDEGGPDRQSIVGNLRDIERIAESLQTGDLSARHPFLLDGMDRFLADVNRARRDAARDRYYMAGRITGACISCHIANY